VTVHIISYNACALGKISAILSVCKLIKGCAAIISGRRTIYCSMKQFSEI